MTTYQSLVARSMSEKELQANVIDAARRLGWVYYHTYDSRRSPEGFPDLILVREGRMICAELKSQRGRLRPQQEVWIDLLREVAWRHHSPIDVHVWRPADWLDGTIEAALRGDL